MFTLIVSSTTYGAELIKKYGGDYEIVEVEFDEYSSNSRQVYYESYVWNNSYMVSAGYWKALAGLT